MPQPLLDSYTEAVRNLVTEALSDEQLEAMCFDHFRAVFEQFAGAQTRTKKIQILIEHCFRQDEFAKLLEQIEKQNAPRYKEFRLEQGRRAAPIRRLVAKAWSEEQLDTICQTQFFPVYDAYSVAPSHADKIRTLIEYCQRRDQVGKLLSLVKEQDPPDYRAFLYRQVHSAVGLRGEQVPSLEQFPEPTPQEYRAMYTAAPPAPSVSIRDFEDFTFRDRYDTAIEILHNPANHIEMYGASGVGKTYILKHLAQQGANGQVAGVYIDLAMRFDVQQVLSEVVRQLRNLPTPPPSATFADLAAAIDDLYSAENGSRADQFLFLFDSASEENRQVIDWLISPDGLINNRQLRDMLEDLGAERAKLQVVIASRRPVVRITRYHRNLSFYSIKLEPLKKEADPKEDPIQLMLREIATHKGSRMPQRLCQKISDEVYYLTGGHPKCAKLALLGVADARFLLFPKDWKRIFEDYVFPTIRQEMLESLPDDDLLPVLSRLSVFRRFDQRLLGALLDRGIITVASDGREASRQARQLRSRLLDTYLINKPSKADPMDTLNFAARRALSLGMQYRLPDRYRAINGVALEIFTNRLQGAQMSLTRSVVSLIELVYHWLKALEMDPDVGPRAICRRVSKGLQDFLPKVLSAIEDDDRPTFLALLEDYWQNDDDLRETALRATGGPTCYQRLSKQINQFIAAFEEVYEES